MEFLLLFWLLSAVVGYFIGNTKGQGGLGCFLGVFLGPIGWLISALSGGKTCPACRKSIHPKASVCPHCRTQLPTA